MPKSSSTDRSRRSEQRKSLGHSPEAQDSKRSTDFVRILTPSNIVYLGAPLPRRSANPPAMQPGKAPPSKGRPSSLDMPRPSAPTAITSSSTTHAIPASTSTMSASPALTTTSVSAILTHFNSPERVITHSRASSVSSDTPNRSQTPKLGPVARLRESSNSNRSPQGRNSSDLGHDTSADDSFTGVYTIPKRRSSLVGSQHDNGASPVQLARRLRATSTSVDESSPRSRNVTFDSTADTQTSRSSAPSTPESAEPLIGDYKEPEVAGEVSTGSSFGAALQSLKEVESRSSSFAPGKGSAGLGSDVLMPAEALHVLEQASRHQDDVPEAEAERDTSTADLRAHSEKQLINEQDKERRQSELDSFQEQSERNEHSVLAEQAQTDNEPSQSETGFPAEMVEQRIETPEPRLRRRRNFSASQMSADVEDEGPVDMPMQASDGTTGDTPSVTGAGQPVALGALAFDSLSAVQTGEGDVATEDTPSAPAADPSVTLGALASDSLTAPQAGDGDGDGDREIRDSQGVLGQGESVAPAASILADLAPIKVVDGTTEDMKGASTGADQSITLGALASEDLTAVQAGNRDRDWQLGTSQEVLEQGDSVPPGASILADLAPVKLDQDTTREMEGATAARRPSATDADVTAALAGEAPSTELAQQVQTNDDSEPKTVEEQMAEREEIKILAKPEEAKELIPEPALTMAKDRNASHRKPGKLTAIERQIKEDGARVSSVTGKGRPGYEVPVKKQKGPRLPINLSLNLQVTIPKRAHKRLPATTTTSGDIGVNLSNKLTYNVQCLGLEISRSSPVGQLLTFGITAAIWVLWATGNW